MECANMSGMKRFAIIGTGAVGGYYGGKNRRKK
jgi:ketopantoate reductase